MHFWPSSSTLSEDGGAAPSANSGGGKGGGGNANASIFSAGAGVPAINAGEIMLSRAETAALAAMETEPDEAHGKRRARQESGLSDSQISILKRRADHALSKGITLKGVGFIRKPTGGPPEEPSLLRKSKAETKEATEKLKETYRTGAYSLPAHSDWKYPQPHSEGASEAPDSVQPMQHNGSLPRRVAPVVAAADTEETNAQSTHKVAAVGRIMKAKRRA